MNPQDTEHSQANILIVDDSRDNLRLLSGILVQEGYIVRPVPDSRLALSSARATTPDIILLDIMLPGMTGYEMCQQLKLDETIRDIPVIFISALDDVFDKVKAFAAGGVDFITKPFQAEEVLVRVRTHLMLRNLQKVLEKKNRQLQQEIMEREQIEEAMRRRNWELDLLNQFTLALQACADEQATYGVLKHICRQLFPLDSGSLYLIQPEKAALDVAIAWGVTPPKAQILDAASWEQRSGRIYTFEHSQTTSLNLHLSGEQQKHDSYPFAMRNASGEVFGILFLQSPSLHHDEFDEEYIRRIESKQLIATRLAEQYSLFLFNLRLRDALKKEAIRDPLTNLFNRRYMEEALVREVQRAARHHTSVGVIMLDVDHFKNFNDTHGHEAGDVVLQQLALLLQSSIRGDDIACRYGGEEFLLILPDTVLKVTEQRAEELLLRTRKLEIPYQKKLFQITISLGVAAFPNHGQDGQAIVSAADTALYAAKNNGRDQVAMAAFRQP